MGDGPLGHSLYVLQARIVCPASLTPEVVNVLRRHSGTTNVCRMDGAVVDPPADLVSADVAREAASDVLAELHRVGVPEHGSVVLTELDVAVGRSIDAALLASPQLEDDALIWEQLESATGEESSQSWTYLAFLTIAVLIAGAGLLTDSPILIVGAMVLGPEFGPLAGLAVALKRRNRRRAWLSARALMVGFLLGIAVTAAGVAILHAAGRVPQAYLDGHEPLTSFVSHPDEFSVIVALLAGVAGTLSLSSAKSTALVGVFISVTTVPAAAGIAAASVTGRGRDALGATAQLGINLACIVVAALLTLTALQQLNRRRVAPSG